MIYLMDGDEQTVGQSADITTAKAWRKVKLESEVVSPLSSTMIPSNHV
jgi:hypothetical protein